MRGDRWYFILNIGGGIDEYVVGMSQGYESESEMVERAIRGSEQGRVWSEQRGE